MLLAALDPDAGVPDSFYLAALAHAVTPEEEVFRRVLVFHRDCLNGGLGQAIENQQDERGSVATYVAAYRTIGLPTVARLVERAASLIASHLRWPWWERQLEAMDERYTHLTYGLSYDEADSIEATAIRFAQSQLAVFQAVADAVAND